MINQAIKNLVEYGISSELITTEDRIYTTNRLLEILGIDDYSEPEAVTSADLETILADFIAYGVENGLLEDSITAKDLFDTKIMGALVPRPSEVIRVFWKRYVDSPDAATDYYYK